MSRSKQLNRGSMPSPSTTTHAKVNATNSLQRIEDIVEDTLTLARQGETVTDPEPVDLSTLVEECWETTATTDATLDLEANGCIYADTSRLRRVLENLFQNAVEHGGDDVTVRVGMLETGFYVADDGPGIPESDRNDIFDYGYTTSDTGTGFGLAIAKEIAEAHGWTLNVTESATGGARFEFTGVSLFDEFPRSQT